MSSNDPWSAIPNLSGQEASALEQTRTGDPSRFFASPRGGEVDAVTGRILNVPHVRLTRDAALSVASATLTAIGWDSALDDNDHMYKGPGLGEVHFRTPGLWLVSAQIYYAPVGVAGTYRQFYMHHIRTGRIWGQWIGPPSGSTGTILAISRQIPMEAGDELICYTAHNDAGSHALNVGADNMDFEACLIKTFGSDSQ